MNLDLQRLKGRQKEIDYWRGELKKEMQTLGIPIPVPAPLPDPGRPKRRAGTAAECAPPAAKKQKTQTELDEEEVAKILSNMAAHEKK